MRLHRAQRHCNCIVDHLPGLFRKKSDMDWENRQKIVWQELDENVRSYRFIIEGKEVKAFYNSRYCFFGIPENEGFRPLSREQLARLKQSVENQRSHAEAKPEKEEEHTDAQSFERSRAQAEIGRLLQERPNLSGAKLAGNTRRIRSLVKKYNLQPPRGI